MKYETTYAAPEKLRTLPTDQLLSVWETTEYLNTAEVPIIRGWLMDEIERRNAPGFNAWLDQTAPADADLMRFVLANPICIDCSKFCNECNGTTCQLWTGCIYRTTRKEG